MSTEFMNYLADTLNPTPTQIAEAERVKYNIRKEACRLTNLQDKGDLEDDPTPPRVLHTKRCTPEDMVLPPNLSTYVTPKPVDEEKKARRRAMNNASAKARRETKALLN